MATYDKASPETVAFVTQRIEEWFPDLVDCEVAIDVLMAYGRRGEGGELASCAIKNHGYPALATIRVLGLKDRAAGRGDVEMLIDGDHWQGMGPAKRAALIDHELYHLAVQWQDEEQRAPKSDDLGRPRLKLRKHDFEIGGFHAIAKRHKEHAPEVEAVREALGGIEVVQLYLPGMGRVAA